ncbi:hypothetical protein RI367_008406 [Sorochytrium milnesiophthora]
MSKVALQAIRKQRRDPAVHFKAALLHFLYAKPKNKLAVRDFVNLVLTAVRLLEPAECLQQLTRAFDESSKTAPEQLVQKRRHPQHRYYWRIRDPKQLPRTLQVSGPAPIVSLLYNALTLCVDSQAVPDTHFFNAFLLLAKHLGDAGGALEIHRTMVEAYRAQQLAGAQPDSETYRVLLQTLTTAQLAGAAKDVVYKFILLSEWSVALAGEVAAVAVSTQEVRLLQTLWETMQSSPDVVPAGAYAAVCEGYGALRQRDAAWRVLQAAEQHHSPTDPALLHARLRLHLYADDLVSALAVFRIPGAVPTIAMFELLIRHLFPHERLVESAYQMLSELIRGSVLPQQDTLIALFSAVFRHNHSWFPVADFCKRTATRPAMMVSEPLFVVLMEGCMQHDRPDIAGGKSGSARFLLRMLKRLECSGQVLSLDGLSKCVSAFAARFPATKDQYELRPFVRTLKRMLERHLVLSLAKSDSANRLPAFPVLLTLLSYYATPQDHTNFVRLYTSAVPWLILDRQTATPDAGHVSVEEYWSQLIRMTQQLPPDHAYALCERTKGLFQDADHPPPYVLLRELMHLAPKQKPRVSHDLYEQATKLYPRAVRETDLLNTIKSLGQLGELPLIEHLRARRQPRSPAPLLVPVSPPKTTEFDANIRSSTRAGNAELAVVTAAQAASLDVDAALSTLGQLKEQQDTVPMSTYTAVILALVRQNRLREAESIWKEAMARHNYQADRYMLNALLDAYRRNDAYDRFTKAVTHMLPNPYMPPATATEYYKYSHAVVDRATVALVLAAGIQRSKTVAPRDQSIDPFLGWCQRFFFKVAADNRDLHLRRFRRLSDSAPLPAAPASVPAPPGDLGLECTPATAADTTRYSVDLQRYHFHLYLQFIQHTRRVQDVQWLFETMDGDRRYWRAVYYMRLRARQGHGPVVVDDGDQRQRISKTALSRLGVASSGVTHKLAQDVLDQLAEEMEGEREAQRKVQAARKWLAEWRADDHRPLDNVSDDA